MRDHGVNVPDPEIGEDGVVEIPDRMPDLAATGASAETIAAAEAACQPILDAVDAFGERPNAQETAEAMDQAIAVAECMRAKGYDMADPRSTRWVVSSSSRRSVETPVRSSSTV